MDQTRIAGIRSGMYFRGLMTDEAVENEVHLSTQDGYDRWAAIYDEEDNPLVMLESRFMPPLVGAVDGLSVLDVGCGTGRHSIQLKEAGAKVTAIDFSERMLDRARAKAGAADICFRQHDLGTRFPFATGGRSGCVCLGARSHRRSESVVCRDEAGGENRWAGGGIRDAPGDFVAQITGAVHRSVVREGDLPGECAKPAV
jgi:SAM-dependent methyltransferase